MSGISVHLLVVMKTIKDTWYDALKYNKNTVFSLIHSAGFRNRNPAQADTLNCL